MKADCAVAISSLKLTTFSLIALYLGDTDVSLLERLPNLGWQPVNEFSSELDGNVQDRIALGEHSAADSVARLRIVMESPARASSAAAARPVAPAPITMTSEGVDMPKILALSRRFSDAA